MVMGRISEILEAARQRGQELGLPYQGAVTPQEAYELMQSAPGVKLVDVRTKAEMDWVGRMPDALEVEWILYPAMKMNPYFMAQLEQEVSREAMVLFVCRSGQRSHHAAVAAMQAGYTSCFNMLEGFEGDRDDDGHRGRVNGWCAAGLPWEQT
jgi:rhodanese-related sulfurtransferase